MWLAGAAARLCWIASPSRTSWPNGWKARRMRNPIKAFLRSFRHTVNHAPMRDRKEAVREMARDTVKRVATRNIRLQRGQYVTREDIDRSWERVKDHRFADE